MRAGRRAIGLALVAVFLGAAACDPAAAQPGVSVGKPSVAPSTNPATTPTPPFTPAEAREAANPDASFDYGFTIQATPQGFHPRWLVAVCCRPIVWKNMTAGPIVVIFDHLGVSSGPIAPGATWSFTPRNVQSIAYHYAANPAVHAVVQVNQPFES